MSSAAVVITVEMVFCVTLLAYMVRLVINSHIESKRAKAERAEAQRLRDNDQLEQEQERAADQAQRKQGRRDKEAAALAVLLKKARQQVRLADGGDLTPEEIEADRRETELDEFKRFCFLIETVMFKTQFDFKQEGLRATMSFRGRDFELRPAGPARVQFLAVDGPLLGTFDRMDENLSNRMVVAMDDYTGSAELTNPP